MAVMPWEFVIFFSFFLHMSKKSSIFAAFFIKSEYNAYTLHIRHS